MKKSDEIIAAAVFHALEEDPELLRRVVELMRTQETQESRILDGRSTMWESYLEDELTDALTKVEELTASKEPNHRVKAVMKQRRVATEQEFSMSVDKIMESSTAWVTDSGGFATVTLEGARCVLEVRSSSEEDALIDLKKAVCAILLDSGVANTELVMRLRTRIRTGS